jgi:hypothetical protein
MIRKPHQRRLEFSNFLRVDPELVIASVLGGQANSVQMVGEMTELRELQSQCDLPW